MVGLPALERVSGMVAAAASEQEGALGDRGVQCLSLQMRKPWPREERRVSKKIHEQTT